MKRPTSNASAINTEAINQSCKWSRQIARESISSMVTIRSDQISPALPNGCPLNMSSNSPNGSPAHIGNSPGRIRRHARSIIKPSGGSNGCAKKNGSVVTIDINITDAIGIASILSVDCSRSNRDSYSRPGRRGRRSAVTTGFFTRPPLRSCRRARLLAGLRGQGPDSFAIQSHRAYSTGQPLVVRARHR